MFTLAANMILIVLAGAMLLGGAALIVIGAVSVLRAKSNDPHAHYSASVTNPDAAGDGTGLPLDFQDQPQWATGDLGGSEVGPPVDHAVGGAAMQREQRRRGIFLALGGLLVAAIGVTLLSLALGHLLG